MKFQATVVFLIASLGIPLHAQLAKALDLNSRGNDAADAGRYDEAIGIYRDALAIWSASGPQYDGHRGGTLLNLGIAVGATGNRLQAVKLMEESLALHRKMLGDRSQRTVVNMNLLASNYLMIGEVDRAEALLNEALPLAREIFPNDVQLARSLEGYCNVLVRNDRPAQAIAPGEEALALAIRVSGEDSIDTALAYSNMGEIHRAAGHPERALPLFRKSRAIYEQRLGSNHERVAALLSQEGLVLMLDGKLAMADQLMTQAVETLNIGCPKCAVETSTLETNLAILRFKQKRYQDADRLLTHVLAVSETFTRTPGRELASTLRLLAAVREKERMFADAEQLNKRAMSITSFR